MRPAQSSMSAMKRAEAAQFSLLYAVTQGNHLSNTASVILLVTEDIQLLAFAFDPFYGFSGMPTWMPYLFNPLSYQPKSKNSFIALFYVGFSITVIAMLLLGLVCSKFQGGTMRNGNTIHIGVGIALASASHESGNDCTFHAASGAVRAAFMCRGFDSDHTLYLLSDPTQCISTLYLMVPAAVGRLYLAVQDPLITLVYFTINPSGHEADSKTTGRVDVIYTICRLALAITHELRVDNPTSQSVVLIATCAIVTYLAIRYQPFCKAQMNDIRAGIFVAGLISAIQSAACRGVGGYDGIAGFVILCAALVPGFAAGYFTSMGYRRWAVQGVYRRLKDPKSVASKKTSLKESIANISAWKPTLKSAPYDGDRNDLNDGDLPSDASNDEENPAGNDGELDVAEVLADVDKIVNARPVEPVKIFLDEWHIEMSCRYLQQNDSPKALHLANKLFEEGARQFPKSAHLILMKAYYIQDFGFQRISNVEHDLRHIKSLHPAFDTRFFMFFKERTLEQKLRQEDLLASHLNVTGFAEVLAMETNARKWHLATLLAWKSFWDYLKSHAASVECMPYLIEMAATNQEMAEKYYSQMVAKYPIANDVEHAQRLLDRAEDIENEESRAQILQSEHLRGKRGSLFSSALSNRERSLGTVKGSNELRHARSQQIPIQRGVGDEGGKERRAISIPVLPTVSAGRKGNMERAISFGADASDMDASEAGDDVPHARTRRTSFALGDVTENVGRDVARDGKSNIRSRVGSVNVEPHLAEHTADKEMATLSRDVSKMEDFGDSRERNRSWGGEKPRRLDGVGEKGREVRAEAKRSEPMLSTPDAVPSWAKKAEPGSLPSVPSATSSQRETRQVQYMKGLFEGRLKSSISKFRHWIIASCIILLGLLIAGCAISLLTYAQITSALSVAYQRMRPQFQIIRMMFYIRRMQSLALGEYTTPNTTYTMNLLYTRFANTIYNIWRNTLIPILMTFHLDDPSTILIKTMTEGRASYQQVNPYFLATMIYDSGDWIMNRTIDWIMANPTQFKSDPHPRLLMENCLSINAAYQATASVGQDSFLMDMNRAMWIMEVLLVVIPLVALLIAVLIFRPRIGKATGREVQMLSLALRLPKKFIVERIEALEIEIENIMEEIEDENAPEDASKLSLGKDIPPAPLWRIMMYSVVFALFGILAAVMFAPALVQSKMGVNYSSLIQEISARAYWETGVAGLAWEVAANDSDCWRPNDSKIWLQYFMDEFNRAQELMMLDNDGGPSILKIPATAAYIN
ncbi:hypothetical protein HDV00_010842 [Rhizophlyctis rosea]|nr:hypothetical protein HDV00_010842 [Rhizophlyctis rosea]